jgi:hypothetical protein
MLSGGLKNFAGGGHRQLPERWASTPLRGARRGDRRTRSRAAPPRDAAASS